jgi:hypothetical protein
MDGLSTKTLCEEAVKMVPEKAAITYIYPQRYGLFDSLKLSKWYLKKQLKRTKGTFALDQSSAK